MLLPNKREPDWANDPIETLQQGNVAPNEWRKYAWSEFPREDLNEMPAMDADGWTPHSRNSVHLETTTEAPAYVVLTILLVMVGEFPYDTVSYTKGEKCCWCTGYIPEKVWTVADLKDGLYQNHRRYPSLEAVREGERCQ